MLKAFAISLNGVCLSILEIIKTLFLLLFTAVFINVSWIDSILFSFANFSIASRKGAPNLFAFPRCLNLILRCFY